MWLPGASIVHTDGIGLHVTALTPREGEVLALIGRGMRCREIAVTLGIVTFTVRKHRSNMLAKLGLHSAAQLVAHAIRVSPPPDAVPDHAALAALTRRERQVIVLVGDGLTSKEIAKRLGISPATVRKHRENVSGGDLVCGE